MESQVEAKPNIVLERKPKSGLFFQLVACQQTQHKQQHSLMESHSISTRTTRTVWWFVLLELYVGGVLICLYVRDKYIVPAVITAVISIIPIIFLIRNYRTVTLSPQGIKFTLLGCYSTFIRWENIQIIKDCGKGVYKIYTMDNKVKAQFQNSGAHFDPIVRYARSSGVAIETSFELIPFYAGEKLPDGPIEAPDSKRIWFQGGPLDRAKVIFIGLILCAIIISVAARAIVDHELWIVAYCLLVLFGPAIAFCFRVVNDFCVMKPDGIQHPYGIFFRKFTPWSEISHVRVVNICITGKYWLMIYFFNKNGRIMFYAPSEKGEIIAKTACSNGARAVKETQGF